MSQELSPEFKKAVEDSKKLTSRPTDDELLQLYAFFKQGSQDPPIEQAPKVGTFEFREKAKRIAWQKLVDGGISPEEAQQKYVDYMEKMKEKHGYNGDA